ncbi:hypothetical protein CDO73_12180 [Saccharibacillus sp. O23]|uniref:hypothetical protein n=1 Tax=Saccharibacillus sp. O23 TaxID=2009338 RepID=UPI000B4E67D4|nr:hypothetical protein [Saccharibacillus sp. O23]OWR29838.1 hypothetical protein CDO73_12180 [Saccharibacillus sp. O23]
MNDGSERQRIVRNLIATAVYLVLMLIGVVYLASVSRFPSMFVVIVFWLIGAAMMATLYKKLKNTNAGNGR